MSRPQLIADDDDGGCPHCLCNPCVTSMPPDCLVGRGTPHLRNVEKRYKLYRKFWGMFIDMRLWGHPIYLRRKQAVTSLMDQREILPKCVVKVCRSIHILKFHYLYTVLYIPGFHPGGGGVGGSFPPPLPPPPPPPNLGQLYRKVYKPHPFPGASPPK